MALTRFKWCEKTRCNNETTAKVCTLEVMWVSRPYLD